SLGPATWVMASGRGWPLAANDVEVIDRDPAEARKLADELGDGAAATDTPGGEVIVLALPYDAVADVIAAHRDALSGKVVVDITNPADWSTMARLVTPEGSSAPEEIARHPALDAHGAR